MEFPSGHFKAALSDVDEVICIEISKWFSLISKHLRANPDICDASYEIACVRISSFAHFLDDAHMSEGDSVEFDIMNGEERDFCRIAVLDNLAKCLFLIQDSKISSEISIIEDEDGKLLGDLLSTLKEDIEVLIGIVPRFDHIWFPDWQELWLGAVYDSCILSIPEEVIPEGEDVFSVYETVRRALYNMTKIYEPNCGFCGARQEDCKKLIMGASVGICNDCIELCNDILIEALEE